MDFIGRMKWWFAFSLLVIVPGVISLFTQGLNKGIDFQGGAIFDLRFEKKVDVGQARSVLAEFNLDKEAVIQASGEKELLIRTKAVNEDVRNRIIKGLEEKFGRATVLAEDRVDPVIGSELLLKALLALLVASVLIMIYIAFRFSDIKFGIAAVIAVLHDVLVVTGIFSLMRWEVDGSFVAAILTIIGYSLMDTIVIFDRIRENLRRKKKDQTLEEVVNDSILQTLNRSVNTVLTVIFILLAMIFFGGGTTSVFVTALLIGVISGAYSSIFNASPLWIVFKRLEQRKKAVARG